MIRDFLIQYAMHVFLAVGLAYAFLKLAIMYKVGLRHNRSAIFLHSIMLYRRQTIKNTFYDRLRKYYKVSNQVNQWFYCFMFLLLIVYGFLIMI